MPDRNPTIGVMDAFEEFSMVSWMLVVVDNYHQCHGCLILILIVVMDACREFSPVSWMVYEKNSH